MPVGGIVLPAEIPGLVAEQAAALYPVGDQPDAATLAAVAESVAAGGDRVGWLYGAMIIAIKEALREAFVPAATGGGGGAVTGTGAPPDGVGVTGTGVGFGAGVVGNGDPLNGASGVEGYGGVGVFGDATAAGAGGVGVSGSGEIGMQGVGVGGPAIQGIADATGDFAPLSIPALPGDPAAPVDGDVWINGATNVLSFRSGGVIYRVTAVPA